MSFDIESLLSTMRGELSAKTCVAGVAHVADTQSQPQLRLPHAVATPLATPKKPRTTPVTPATPLNLELEKNYTKRYDSASYPHVAATPALPAAAIELAQIAQTETEKSWSQSSVDENGEKLFCSCQRFATRSIQDFHYPHGRKWMCQPCFDSLDVIPQPSNRKPPRNRAKNSG